MMNADYLEDVVVFFNDKSSFVLPTDAGQNAVQGNGDTPTSASETSIGDQIIVYTANEDENKFSVPNNVDCQQKVIVPEDKIFIENFADEPSMKSSLETFVNEEILIDDIDHNELTPTTSSLNIAKYKSTSISETSSISEEIVSEASDNEYLSINVSHSEEVCLKSTSSNRLIEIQPETVIIKTDTITLDDDQLLANEEHSITPTSVLDDDTCPFSSPLSVESYIQDDIDTLITNKTDHVAAAIKQVVSQIFDDEDHLSSSSLKFNSTSDDENLFEDTVSIQDDRSYLQNQIQDLTTECEHLLKDNESFSKEIKALRSKFHQLILEKEKITQDCNDDLFDYSEAVKEKEEIIEELNKDVQWYTDESNAYKEKNDKLQAEIQQLKNTSDKQKITEEKLCEDKTLLNTKAKVLESDIDEKKIIVQRLCEDNNFLKDKAELLQRTLNQQKLKKEKLSEENVSLKDKTEVLQRTLDQHKLKEEKLSEQNVSLKAKTEVLQSMVDKHKTAAERFVTENNTLKQELEKVKSSEDEKKKLKKVSLMMDDLINENNKLKTELDLATKEKKNTENLYKTLDQHRIKEKNLSEENLSLKDNIEVLQSDLDELVWKHKELEEYNLFMEDIFNERDAVLCRKDSETIIAKLETENIRLSDQFQRLQSQSRKERKTHDVFGTRKLKAIQDLERKLVDLRYKNKTLKQQLTDESFKNDALQSTFDVLDIQIHNHRMKSEELAEELDRASEENDDLQQELVQVKKLLQNATNNQLFFQPMAVHNKKLMVQNASLQDSHLGLPTNTIGIDHITSENSPPDLYSSTMNALKRTSNNVNIATLKVVESFDGISSNSSVISSTDDRNSSLPTTNHNMTPSHKTYVNRQWQENMTSMFGEQNKQMTLFKQQVMDDIVDIKRQVAESIPTNKTNYVDNNNTEKSEELTILKRKVKTLKHQLLEQNKTNARNVALSVQKDGKIECLTGIVEAITATNQKLMEENNAWKALKYKNMISAGDTKLQNKTETSKKIGDSSNRPTISDESATTTKTIVSKDKRLKALFAHQEQRMHTIMEKSMERSKTQMDNFRKQFNEMICIAKVSKSKVTGNSTNKDDDDLTEAMGDIPYWTTHSTENDTNDITISSKPTRQPSQKGHSNETEHTHTKAFRGFV
ncbi:uncharacterized protein [Antedon mediterranea]|uniref:uncharacterized protein n=1 Tax=Antedon mediterranea TaxID=105859 RepID=UPI003AF8E8CA